MELPYFKVKLLDKKAKLPAKRDEDAGYDVYTVLDEDFFMLNRGETHLFPTKVSAEIPKDWVLYVAERGSTASKGIAKRAGIIDSGYRGEIFIALNNTSNKPIIFTKHEDEKLDKYLEENKITKEDVTIYPQSKAIAQMLLLYCPHVEVEEVHELGDSVRGEGALGSSGK